MAKETKNHQIVLNIKPQLGRESRGLGQQLASAISKELTPAITKAITEGFSKAQGQIRQTTKRTAETTAKEQVRAVDQAAAKQKKAADDFDRYKLQLTRKQLKYEEDVAKAEENRQRRTARSRRDAQIALEAGVQQERQRRETQETSRVRRTAQVTRAAEAAGVELRPGRAEALAAGPRAQFASVMERLKDEASEKRKESKEREKTAKAKSSEQLKESKEERARERTQYRAAERAFDARMSGMRRDVRRISGAEGELARIEGLDDPRLAEVDAAAARIGRPAIGSRLARARRLGTMFPGAGRMAQMTGLPVGLIRGGMAAGPIIGGIASGNMLAGAGGGGISGFQTAGLAGMGGVGGAALGGIGVIVGAIGAGVVNGMRKASAQVPQALQFLHGVQGILSGLEPSEQANLGARTRDIIGAATGMAAFGMEPMQALDIMGRFQQARGGWQNTQRMRNERYQALMMYRAFGVSPETTGQIAFARRRGGLALGAFIDPENMAERAIELGFQGPEIGGFQQRQADLMTRAFGQGTFYQMGPHTETIKALSPAVGQFQAERFATGMGGALQNIATRGIGGAPSPEIGLMMLQAYGGLQLPQKGGVSADAVWNSLKRIEAGEYDPEESRKALFRSVSGAAGGSVGLTNIMLQNLLGEQGMPFGPSGIESLRANRPSGPLAADIAWTITSAEEAQEELKKYQKGGGLEGRAKGITIPELSGQAAILGTGIAAGLKAMPGAQALDQAMAELAEQVAELSSFADKMKAALTTGLKMIVE